MFNQVRVVAARRLLSSPSGRRATSTLIRPTALSYATPYSDFTGDGQYFSAYSVPGPVWSGSLSFASPVADFNSLSTRTYSLDPEWSKALSFGSPEADFACAPVSEDVVCDSNETWSRALSFASPNSDFVAQVPALDIPAFALSLRSSTKQAMDRSPTTSGVFSFATPESDFSAVPIDSTISEPEWSHSMCWASPETDFSTNGINNVAYANADTQEWGQAVSFASPETDYCSREQELAWSIVRHDSLSSFPLTLGDVLSNADLQHRPLVVTTMEAPHKIVHVNQAWEQVYGVSRLDILHQPLESLLLFKRDNEEEELMRATMQALAQQYHSPQPTQAMLKSKRLTTGPLYLPTTAATSSIASPFSNLHHLPPPPAVAAKAVKEGHGEAHFLVTILDDIMEPPQLAL
jgi:PAS domain-containing protein